jgi:mono/diheme cytochrome c family protein
MRTFLGAVFVLCVLVAQGGARATQTAPEGQPAAGDPVNGRTVYTTLDCHTCHGVDGVGAWAPDLAGKGVTFAQAYRAIRVPVWRMPMFTSSQLSDKEIADMVAYWSSASRPATLGTWRREMVGSNAPRAQQLVVNILGCAQCHTPTLDLPRRGAGEVNGDFEWFKRMVYDHQTTQAEQWKELDASAPVPPTRNRVRMGRYLRERIPETTLREIWDWMVDIGFLVPVQARLTAGMPDAAGTTYTLNVTNAAVPNKGLSAEDATISLVVPAGMKVVSADGPGSQGVTRDAKDNTEVATWRVPKIAPRDQQRYTITLAGTAAGGAVPRGYIGWARPVAKEDALVRFTLPQPAGRGRGGVAAP